MTDSNPFLTIVCIVIILIFAVIGGIGVKIFTQGYRDYKPFISFLIFPTVLAQILWGALIKNGIPELFESSYRDEYFEYPRLIGITLILIKTGFDLEEPQLRRKSIWMRALLCTSAEIIVVAILSNLLLNLPWLYSISLGGIIATSTPGTLASSLLKMKNCPILDKKALAFYTSTLNKCSTIIGLLVYEIFKSIDDKITKHEAFSDIVANLTIEVLCGVGAAGLMLCLSYLMKNTASWIKITTFAVAFFLVNLLTTHNDMLVTLLLAAVLFGYGVKFLWKESTPSASIDQLWYLSMPFLFGFVGAQVDVGFLEYQRTLWALLVVTAGILVRVLIGYLSASSKNEHPRATCRVVLALSGACKAELQGAFGGALIWTKASRETSAIFLNTCILSMLLSVAVGAILNECLKRKLNSMLSSRGISIYETDLDAKGIKELPHYVTEEEIIAPPELPQERPLEDIVGWASSENVD
jgi:hypothetical protein